MNQLVVTLAIILLPGIVAAVISDKITVHSKWTPFIFILYAFVLGVFSYTLLQIGYFTLGIVGKLEKTPITWTYLQVWANAVGFASSVAGISEAIRDKIATAHGIAPGDVLNR